ncbi:tyrosine-type recombinase/integrase [Streptomyces coelicoflavus]|uniref:tyrosine-type recombinase/integrase n=1 Tax=Streptomyces coelicoflavus TaxID=285562 RepID=UPI0036418D2E
MTQIYAEKKRTAPSVAEARRELGQKTVAEYAKQWLPRQRRMTAYSTGEHVSSSINVHIVPRLGSRKLISVTPIVVERFLDELEAGGVGRGNQVNILRTLKAILRDAYDKVAMADDPVKGVQEPEYVRQKVVIPDLAYLKQALAVAGDDLALEIVMMAGCGLRNGEARAVNVNNVVADDVYRVHEQIHSNTHRPAKLKHRKVGEFREVPLPRSVREAIERHEKKHGTTREGYLLRGPSGYYTEPMERRRVRTLFEKLPGVDGMGMYGFRHYFASNALGSGIPITDVAERMGHKSIEKTYRTYRHLMPGSITRQRVSLRRASGTRLDTVAKPVVLLSGWAAPAPLGTGCRGRPGASTSVQHRQEVALQSLLVREGLPIGVFPCALSSVDRGCPPQLSSPRVRGSAMKRQHCHRGMVRHWGGNGRPRRRRARPAASTPPNASRSAASIPVLPLSDSSCRIPHSRAERQPLKPRGPFRCRAPDG